MELKREENQGNASGEHGKRNMNKEYVFYHNEFKWLVTVSGKADAREADRGGKVIRNALP